MSPIIEIEIINWEKYNPRSDRKNHSWFRLENTIATEPKFHGLSAAQRFVAICLFAEVSKNQGAVTSVDLEWLCFQLQLKPKEIVDTINHLKDRGVIRLPDGNQLPPNEVSAGNQSVSDGITTNERTNERTPVVPLKGDGANFPLKEKFQELAEKYQALFPGTVIGGKAEERFRSQIRTFEEIDQLEAAMRHYRTLLNAEDWRKPKTSFQNFLGTKRSGFFWRDYIQAVKVVQAHTLGGILEV